MLYQSPLLLVASFSLALHLRAHGRSGLRVRQGYNDTEGRYPYVVSLVIQSVRFCTGTLISSQWVLTAAHCNAPKFAEIRYGNMTELPSDSNTKRLVKFIKYDSYIYWPKTNNMLFKHDIAVARVDEVKMTFYGRLSSVDYTTLTGLAVEYAGYGITRYPPTWEDLKTSIFQLGRGIVTKCMEVEYQAQFYYGPFICVSSKCGEEQQTVLSGDSGGPLVQDGRVVGVASHIIEPTRYQAFTPVSLYLEWIHKTVDNYIDTI